LKPKAPCTRPTATRLTHLSPGTLLAPSSSNWGTVLRFRQHRNRRILMGVAVPSFPFA